MATPNPNETFREPMPLVHKAGTWFIFTAVAFIVLGTLAILAPFTAGLAITTLVGWLLLVAGVMHIISAFKGSFGRGLWQTLVGLFYLAAGAYFLTHPVVALGTLTFLLACVLFFEAIMGVTAWWAMRHEDGAGWILVSTFATAVLAVLIWMNWPSVSVWAIGTLVGIKLMISGFSRLMLGNKTQSFEKRVERFVE